MKFLPFSILTILLIVFSTQTKAQSVEYSMKALFIEKFARYTEWEPNSIDDHFDISVLGKSPFKGELEKMAQKTTIKNRPIRILYIKDFREIKDIRTCNILFICSSEKKKITEILRAVNNKNILTISDTPGFGEEGVHFNFYLRENSTIHFEINIDALTKSNFKTDMQLLNIGKIIK